MRLPRQVRLPFGYTVQVKEVTDAEMRAEAEDELVDGLWDADVKTIYIRRALAPKRKKYILGHEFGHAYLDWTHSCFDEGAFKP